MRMVSVRMPTSRVYRLLDHVRATELTKFISPIFLHSETVGIPSKLLHHVHADAQAYAPEVSERPALQQFTVSERASRALLRQGKFDLLAFRDNVRMVRRVAVLQLRQDAGALLRATMRHAPTRTVRKNHDLQEKTERENCLEAWVLVVSLYLYVVQMSTYLPIGSRHCAGPFTYDIP